MPARRPGLSPHRQEMIVQPWLRPHPLDRILEVFERNVDEAARQPLHGKITQIERGLSVRREDGATVLVNSAAAAIEHDHGRMRTIARREEQRADDTKPSGFHAVSRPDPPRGVPMSIRHAFRQGLWFQAERTRAS